LVFHERFQEFDLRLSTGDMVDTPKGTFLPLGSFVCALYSHFPKSRSVFEFLSDIRANLPLRENFSRREFTRPEFVCPALSGAGFEIVSVSSYGRRVWASLAWTYPQKRFTSDPTDILSVGSLVFRPMPNGDLKGESWPTEHNRRFEELLWHSARTLCNGESIRALSDDGKRFVLSTFEWTPLARMTTSEARSARLAFIAEHPELHHAPKDLANALKAGGLYSPDTTVSQIVKFIKNVLSKGVEERGQ
jgi:hypothetical protein